MRVHYLEIVCRAVGTSTSRFGAVHGAEAFI